MVAGIARIGKRIARKIEGDGDHRHDHRGENQHVGILHKQAARVAELGNNADVEGHVVGYAAGIVVDGMLEMLVDRTANEYE